MLEGALIWDSSRDENQEDGRWFIGENVYTVFNRLTEHLAEGEQPHFLQPIEDCLDGKIAEDVVAEEHQFSMWYPSNFSGNNPADKAQMIVGTALVSCPPTET